MSKLYKAIVLTQNEYDYVQVRYCNDLKSRIYRLTRDKHNVIKQYENDTLVSKLELCRLMLSNVEFDSDVQKIAVESAILKLAKLEKSNTQELLAVNM